jgi:hypothetical protein
VTLRGLLDGLPELNSLEMPVATSFTSLPTQTINNLRSLTIFDVDSLSLPRMDQLQMLHLTMSKAREAGDAAVLDFHYVPNLLKLRLSCALPHSQYSLDGFVSGLSENLQTLVLDGPFTFPSIYKFGRFLHRISHDTQLRGISCRGLSLLQYPTDRQVTSIRQGSTLRELQILELVDTDPICFRGFCPSLTKLLIYSSKGLSATSSDTVFELAEGPLKENTLRVLSIWATLQRNEPFTHGHIRTGPLHFYPRDFVNLMLRPSRLQHLQLHTCAKFHRDDWVVLCLRGFLEMLQIHIEPEQQYLERWLLKNDEYVEKPKGLLQLHQGRVFMSPKLLTPELLTPELLTPKLLTMSDFSDHRLNSLALRQQTLGLADHEHDFQFIRDECEGKPELGQGPNHVRYGSDPQVSRKRKRVSDSESEGEDF